MCPGNSNNQPNQNSMEVAWWQHIHHSNLGEITTTTTGTNHRYGTSIPPLRQHFTPRRGSEPNFSKHSAAGAHKYNSWLEQWAPDRVLGGFLGHIESQEVDRNSQMDGIGIWSRLIFNTTTKYITTIWHRPTAIHRNFKSKFQSTRPILRRRWAR